jgi:hypothetical protein
MKTAIYHKKGVCRRNDYKKAKVTFDNLVSFMRRISIKDQIAAAHKRGASSQKIQNIILDHARSDGFDDEREGLFRDYPVNQLRPDYYKSLNGQGKGIILEVERGKTLKNNMDILDLWKCHICVHANFLFLIVPVINQRQPSVENVFEPVKNRMSTFFTDNNNINVDAVFIIGY